MQHVRARKWDQTNTSRSLAISMSLEANELLEYFQWDEESFGGKTELQKGYDIMSGNNYD